MATAKTASLVSEDDRRRLRLLATPSGASGYAEWLRGTAGSGTENSALLSAAKEADRSAVDYGAAGERLSSSGLADDGYASYLRLAAKEARAERRAELERSRADSGAALLRGYADYLKEEKAAAGDRLYSTAQALAKGTLAKEEAEALIAASGARGAAGDALRAFWRAPTKEPELSPEKAVSYLVKNQMPSERALEYCLLIGYGEEEARQLVKEAELQRSKNTDRLLDLMGH